MGLLLPLVPGRGSSSSPIWCCCRAGDAGPGLLAAWLLGLCRGGGCRRLLGLLLLLLLEICGGPPASAGGTQLIKVNHSNDRLKEGSLRFTGILLFTYAGPKPRLLYRTQWQGRALVEHVIHSHCAHRTCGSSCCLLCWLRHLLLLLLVRCLPR